MNSQGVANLVPVLPCEAERIADRVSSQVFNGFSWETLTGPENLLARLKMCARQAVSEALEEAANAARTPLPAGALSQDCVDGWVDAQQSSSDAIRSLSKTADDVGQESAGASVGPGSCPAGQAASRLDGARFDPSRTIVALEKFISTIRAMEPRNPMAPIVRSALEHVAEALRQGVCDTDGSPQGTDAQRLDGVAATAGAEGIANTSTASNKGGRDAL